MQFDYQLVLVFGEVTAFQIRAKVVDPAEAAALAATEQSRGFRKGSPIAFSVRSDVRSKAIVFFLGPGALVGVGFLAARRSSHGPRFSVQR